jgi:hypothetical protein
MIRKKKAPKARKKAAAKPKGKKTLSKTNASPRTAGASEVLKIDKDVLTRKNGDGSVAVMRLDNDEYFFTCDGLAAEIWNAIDGRSSIEAIQVKLQKKYSPPQARFKKDLTNLIRKLKKERLVL